MIRPRVDPLFVIDHVTTTTDYCRCCFKLGLLGNGLCVRCWDSSVMDREALEGVKNYYIEVTDGRGWHRGSKRRGGCNHLGETGVDYTSLDSNDD